MTALGTVIPNYSHIRAENKAVLALNTEAAVKTASGLSGGQVRRNFEVYFFKCPEAFLY